MEYKKGYQATCKCCGVIMMGKIDVLHKHLALKCVDVAEDVKRWAKDQLKGGSTPTKYH